jgi:hypothetical protein
MAFPRSLACLAVVAASLTAALAAEASSTDGCAQRVIRDWYDGGRVDGVYPLRCYRAAIRALPEDVLQYSDARNEIQRALASAADGKRDRTAVPKSQVERSELPVRSTPRRAAARPTPPRARSAPTTPATPRGLHDPVQIAARDDVQVADARGLPYPVIVLATLAALLLATAAATRVLARRRGSGSTPDR